MVCQALPFMIMVKSFAIAKHKYVSTQINPTKSYLKSCIHKNQSTLRECELPFENAKPNPSNQALPLCEFGNTHENMKTNYSPYSTPFWTFSHIREPNAPDQNITRMRTSCRECDGQNHPYRSPFHLSMKHHPLSLSKGSSTTNNFKIKNRRSKSFY